MLLVFTAEYIVESYDFIFEGFLAALDRICPVSSSERQEHRALEYLKLFLKIVKLLGLLITITIT